MPEPLPPAVTAAVEHVAGTLGVPAAGARPLRLHDAATIMLPDAGLVVRLVHDTGEARSRGARALRLTAWLTEQEYATVVPAYAQPIITGGYVATVWNAVPRAPAPPLLVTLRALGHLLRELHSLPSTPIALPAADPFARLRAALDQDSTRQAPVLTAAELRFLTARIDELSAEYTAMSFPLGTGLIHNDAHPGNLLPAPAHRYGHVLTDWEGACLGPREMDVVLVGAPGSRFGDTPDERLAFTAGYGYDIAGWPGHTTLRDIRDLHSLAAHIRSAPRNPAAARELRRRLESLLHDDRTIVWAAV